MIRRSILYTILLSMNVPGLLQADMKLFQHPTVKKVRKFLDTKKRPIAVAMGMTLVGVSGIWCMHKLLNMPKETGSLADIKDEADVSDQKSLNVPKEKNEGHVKLFGQSLCDEAKFVWEDQFSIKVTVKLSKARDKQFLIITPEQEGIPEDFLRWYSEEKRNEFLDTVAQKGEMPTGCTFVLRYKQGPKFFELDRFELDRVEL